jgi:hypothetical protein
MPTPIVTPVTAPIIIVNNTPSKSEAEIMKENGGHIYFSVHLKRCEECRAEKERLDRAEKHIAWLVLGVMFAVILFCVVLLNLSEMKEWFDDKVANLKRRFDPWYDLDNEATELKQPHNDEHLVYCRSVYSHTSQLWDAIKSERIITQRRGNGDDYHKIGQYLERFIYVTSEASFYIVRKRSLTGTRYHAFRIPMSTHGRLYELKYR